MTTAQTKPNPKPKQIMVDVADIHPNPWNPNEMTPEIYEKAKRSVERHGFVDPVTVRETKEGFQIIDGEHRYKVAVDLGLKNIMAVNLGRISDEDAQRLTILFNELHGDPEPVKLAKLIKDLAQFSTPEALALDLPMEPAEIDSLIKASEFSWESLNPDPAPRGQDANPNGMQERRLVVASIQGNVPVRLTDAFAEEWKRSSESIGSNNTELVFQNIVDRLKGNPPPPREEGNE